MFSLHEIFQNKLIFIVWNVWWLELLNATSKSPFTIEHIITEIAIKYLSLRYCSKLRSLIITIVVSLHCILCNF